MPRYRPLLACLSVISIFVGTIALIAWIFLPSDSDVFSVARWGMYIQFQNRLGQSQLTLLPHYPRAEPVHWPSMPKQIRGYMYLDEDPCRPGYPWLRSKHIGVIDAFDAPSAPWPSGWPPEMLDGTFRPAWIVVMPSYLPPLLSTILPALWLLAWAGHIITNRLSHKALARDTIAA